MDIESGVVFFPCKDIKETSRYYSDVLKLPVYKDLGKTVWFDCGYGYIAFVEYSDGRPMASGACISFNMSSIEEVDKAYDHISQSGVIGLKGAPQKHPIFPVYSFFFSDPNGYTLECQNPLD